MPEVGGAMIIIEHILVPVWLLYSWDKCTSGVCVVSRRVDYCITMVTLCSELDP